MVKFKELKIERVQWGPDEGKLKGKLNISTKHGELSLNLKDELADKILQLARGAMIDAVEHTANEFIFEITIAIPETPLLGNNQDQT